MAKEPKSNVSYSPGMAESHCGQVFKDDKGYCQHFWPQRPGVLDGQCRKVEGTIKRTYWCQRFEKAK